ncbi:MAG: hypothetical protein ACR2IK_15725 [Chloroflexota bacterium]
MPRGYDLDEQSTASSAASARARARLGASLRERTRWPTLTYSDGVPAACPTEAKETSTVAITALARSLVGTSTALPSAVGLLLSLAVVLGHLWMLGNDPAVFVRAAPPFASPATAPASLRILEPEQTYDGQFFYRLAVDPLLTRDVGVNLDHPSYRQQRMLYPFFVRVLSLGQDAWVPWLLIAANVVGLTALGALGGRFAVELGAPAWWGIGLPFWAGFSFSLARDLSEIVQACFFVATLLLLQQGRSRLAAAPMTLAVLARETATLLAFVLLASSVVERVTGRRGPARDAWVAGLAGLAWFVGVQAVLWARWGTPPLADGVANLAMPMMAPLRYLGMVGLLGRIEFAYFALLFGLSVLSPCVPGYVRLALVGYVALTLSLSTTVWEGDVAWLRAATEAAMLGWVSIFHANRHRAVIALAVTAVLWPAVARWAIAT